MKGRRLVYTPEALTDLKDIRAHIRSEAGGASSARMIERIRTAIRNAREMPNAGVARPEYRATCRFVIARPYVVYYDFDGTTLAVLRVLHQSRDRDSIMTPTSKPSK